MTKPKPEYSQPSSSSNKYTAGDHRTFTRPKTESFPIQPCTGNDDKSHIISAGLKHEAPSRSSSFHGHTMSLEEDVRQFHLTKQISNSYPTPISVDIQALPRMVYKTFEENLEDRISRHHYRKSSSLWNLPPSPPQSPDETTSLFSSSSHSLNSFLTFHRSHTDPKRHSLIRKCSDNISIFTYQCMSTFTKPFQDCLGIRSQTMENGYENEHGDGGMDGGDDSGTYLAVDVDDIYHEHYNDKGGWTFGRCPACAIGRGESVPDDANADGELRTVRKFNAGNAISAACSQKKCTTGTPTRQKIQSQYNALEDGDKENSESLSKGVAPKDGNKESDIPLNGKVKVQHITPNAMTDIDNDDDDYYDNFRITSRYNGSGRYGSNGEDTSRKVLDLPNADVALSEKLRMQSRLLMELQLRKRIAKLETEERRRRTEAMKDKGKGRADDIRPQGVVDDTKYEIMG